MARVNSSMLQCTENFPAVNMIARTKSRFNFSSFSTEDNTLLCQVLEPIFVSLAGQRKFLFCNQFSFPLQGSSRIGEKYNNNK